MPCPPSYEELEEMRLNSDFNFLRTELPKMVDRAKKTLKLLEDLKKFASETNVEGKTVRSFNKYIVKLSALLDFDMAKMLQTPTIGKDTWPTMEEIERGQAHRDKMSLKYREIELELCESGCLVYNIRDILMDLGVGMPSSLDEALNTEVKKYREHRKSDKEARLNELEQMIRSNLNWVKQFPDDAGNQERLDEIPRLKTQIEKIKKLPEEAYLKDRLLFFKD